MHIQNTHAHEHTTLSEENPALCASLVIRMYLALIVRREPSIRHFSAFMNKYMWGHNRNPEERHHSCNLVDRSKRAEPHVHL